MTVYAELSGMRFSRNLNGCTRCPGYLLLMISAGCDLQHRPRLQWDPQPSMMSRVTEEE